MSRMPSHHFKWWNRDLCNTPKENCFRFYCRVDARSLAAGMPDLRTRKKDLKFLPSGSFSLNRAATTCYSLDAKNSHSLPIYRIFSSSFYFYFLGY